MTGATGFVGYHLCEALHFLDAEVYGLSRSAGASTLPNYIHGVSVDLRSLKSTRKAIQAIKPEIVFHLAGLVNTRQDIKLVIPTFGNNLSGSVHLFVALTEIECQRLVVAGSSEEPDVSKFGTSPNSPYAAAKDAETSYARMFQKIFALPVVIARPFMSYGPRQPLQKVVPYTITSLINEKTPKISSGKRICDLIFIQDLVVGLVAAGFKPGLTGSIVDIGTGVGTTVRDAVSMIRNLMNSSLDPTFGAIQDRLYEYPQIANIEKTTDLLGWRPHFSLEEGFKRTIDWYRNHPEFQRR